MEQRVISLNRPLLKSRGMSTHHIEIFELMLAGKSNREVNQMMGYSQRSHSGVDHSRKVMYKLLALEGLCRRDHVKQVASPREYCFWWNNILSNNRNFLTSYAIKPEYY